jgi:hypothetical protein
MFGSDQTLLPLVDRKVLPLHTHEHTFPVGFDPSVPRS